MFAKNLFSRLLIVSLAIFSLASQAEPLALKDFKPGSYQQILDNHSKQPFMMVVWSITCSSCLKDMALLSTIHKSKPDLKIVMLSTDDASANAQIGQILVKNGLTSLENWRYADENTQKLQYEIDPKWFGELPRTYFFDKAHQRQGVSGVLSQADYEARIAKVLP